MSYIANLVAPYLPGPAQDVLRAVDPILSLVSNPVNLAWTAYRNPQQILSTLGQTGSNLYSVSKDMDFKSMYGDLQDRIQHGGMSDLTPLLVGAIAIFFTFRSLMGTFRYGYRLVGTLVRYGSLISLLIAAVGWITGGQQQGNQGGIANILGGLTGAGNNNNNNGGNGMANGLFNMAKDYATGAANGQQGAGNGVWDQAQGLFANMQGQQQNTGSKPNTRSTKQRATRDKAAAAAGTNTNAGEPDLSNIAQGWVKDALLKATGLDSLFGGAAPENKQKAKDKKGEARRNAAR
ncbi:hypothetical protein QFC22_001367 [Naganishia vaughanmartiniae]|uniref:Uncharacterized protein n=1 Tax=Naganishia vaughanmartiniae TaxID=1424756 RepID=A0ACC2XGL8_9TREE|nr:hypothetical protein QFC22_001367 [Naganishia vaughanmartiniae]